MTDNSSPCSARGGIWLLFGNRKGGIRLCLLPTVSKQRWNTWSFVRQGLICTVSLSALTVIFGFVLALLLAVMRLSNFQPFRFLAITPDGHAKEEGFVAALSRFNPIRFIATVYVEVFRATPMLVQLFFVYYVLFGNVELPSFKIFGFIRFERFLPGVVALALNSGAYLSEIIRAGHPVHRRRPDRGLPFSGPVSGADHAVHHSAPGHQEHPAPHRQRVRYHYQGIFHLLYHRCAGDHVAVTSIKGATYRIAEPLVIATIVYFCLTFPTSKIIAYFERRMSRGDKR